MYAYGMRGPRLWLSTLWCRIIFTFFLQFVRLLGCKSIRLPKIQLISSQPLDQNPTVQVWAFVPALLCLRFALYYPWSIRVVFSFFQVQLGVATGAGRPASTRPDPSCATRRSRTGGLTGQPVPAPLRGGSKRVDPSRGHGTNPIRPVTNHGTSRVGENFPDPPFLLLFFFLVQ